MPFYTEEYLFPLYCILAGIFVVLGLVFIKKPSRKKIAKAKPKLNIPGYTLFYTDKKTGERKEGVHYSTLLFDEETGISGKPDYIFKKKHGRDLVPVELKSGTIGELAYPRQGDLLQLCAYFIIVQNCFGIKPSHGRLVYSDYMFVIRNTKSLRREVLSVVGEMRRMLEEPYYFKPQPSFIMCRHCICRGTVCEYCEGKNANE